MIASDKIVEKRKSICDKCIEKRPEFKFLFIKLRSPQCKVCKCLIDAKTKLSFSKCPKGKW